jgi:hypothetical protein
MPALCHQRTHAAHKFFLRAPLVGRNWVRKLEHDVGMADACLTIDSGRFAKRRVMSCRQGGPPVKAGTDSICVDASVVTTLIGPPWN